MAGRLRRWLLVCLLFHQGAQAAPAATNPCERAATESEITEHLPPGLLAAIGRVETGRWDAAQARMAPWPWALNVNGVARWFASRDAALQALTGYWAQGVRSIDVGCFQVNLLHHPTAFSDLTEALDPAANGAYAARFLTLLHSRLGNWNAAVAAYHSADPALGTPYQRLVFSHLQGPAIPSVPIQGFRVWTPAESVDDMHVVSLTAIAGGPGKLPRVIVPGR
jgi:hypothetical protein